MSYVSTTNPDDAWDFVPTCRFDENCGRLFIPGGCNSCECMDDTLLRDEDGDPIAIPDEAPDSAK